MHDFKLYYFDIQSVLHYEIIVNTINLFNYSLLINIIKINLNHHAYIDNVLIKLKGVYSHEF